MANSHRAPVSGRPWPVPYSALSLLILFHEWVSVIKLQNEAWCLEKNAKM